MTFPLFDCLYHSYTKYTQKPYTFMTVTYIIGSMVFTPSPGSDTAITEPVMDAVDA